MPASERRKTAAGAEITCGKRNPCGSRTQASADSAAFASKSRPTSGKGVDPWSSSLVPLSGAFARAVEREVDRDAGPTLPVEPTIRFPSTKGVGVEHSKPSGLPPSMDAEDEGLSRREPLSGPEDTKGSFHRAEGSGDEIPLAIADNDVSLL